VSPIDLTEAEIVTDVNELQSLNAEYPIEIVELPIVTDVNELQ